MEPGRGIARRPRVTEPRQPFLFDLDGTLCDTLADIAASANHVRASHGLPPAPLAALRAMIGDGALTLLRRALADLRPQPPPDDACWQRAWTLYQEHHAVQCTVHAQPYPGVRAHLERWAGAGHPLAVVTNKPERFARPILHHVGLADLLPVVIGGDTLPQKKPDPAPLREALRRLGQPDRSGTMVGDGETDLRAGRAAGLRTIAVLYGYRPEAALRAVGADEYWTRFGG